MSLLIIYFIVWIYSQNWICRKKIRNNDRQIELRNMTRKKAPSGRTKNINKHNLSILFIWKWLQYNKVKRDRGHGARDLGFDDYRKMSLSLSLSILCVGAHFVSMHYARVRLNPIPCQTYTPHLSLDSHYAITKINILFFFYVLVLIFFCFYIKLNQVDLTWYQCIVHVLEHVG